jgi:hypothetical protein
MNNNSSNDQLWGYFDDDNDVYNNNINSTNSINIISSSFSPSNSFSPDYHDKKQYNHSSSNKMRKMESLTIRSKHPRLYSNSSDNSDLSDDGNYNSDTTISSSSSSALSSIPSSSSISNQDTDKTIICRMDNILSSTSCRSFSDLSIKGGYGRWEDVTIGLRGFRIIQTESRGEEAEFCVVLTTNNNEYCCWKPYSCFAEIAEACKAVHSNMKEKLLFEQEVGHEISDEEWRDITNQNLLYRPREFDILLSYIYDSFTGTSSGSHKRKLIDTSFSGNLNNSLEAWNCVVKSRSIWNKKNLEVNHLIKESQKLDNFLKQMLFDINSPAILIEFMKSSY